MFNFGKKKKRRSSKKIDDKKTNTKTKKQDQGEDTEVEKKPWGKFERYVVLGTLLSTIAISATLAIYARSWKLPNVPRMVIPDDAFEDTFVIENKTKSSDHNEIITEFETRTKSLSGVYGFGVHNLITDDSYGKFNTEIFQAASLIKLPLMSMVYELAEDDRLSLDSVYTLKDADKIAGSGSIYNQDEGTVFTIRELVEAMGKQSDNTAYNVLKSKVGEDNLQDYIEEIGMRKTSVSDNTTTINDITLFFTKLWENRLVNSDSKDEILTFLTDTIYETHLPSNLPEDIRVAHKYGREIHVINDAGIVYSDKPFVLVIMTKGVVEKEADQAFSGLAKLLFDYETNR